MELHRSEDAYGQAMLDYFHGRGGWEIVEREDGFASIGAGPERYFDSFRLWPGAERRVMRYVVAPSGEMLLASVPRLEQALSCELDLSQVQPAWS